MDYELLMNLTLPIRFVKIFKLISEEHFSNIIEYVVPISFCYKVFQSDSQHVHCTIVVRKN